MAERHGSGNESPDPFGLRSAMARRMRERGDDPASRARRAAEEGGEVTDEEIADLLGPRTPRDGPAQE